jgi:hypothetical protein
MSGIGIVGADWKIATQLKDVYSKDDRATDHHGNLTYAILSLLR